MKKIKIYLFILCCLFMGPREYTKPPRKAVMYEKIFREVLNKSYPELREMKVWLVWSNQSSPLMNSEPASAHFFLNDSYFQVYFSVNKKYGKFLEGLSPEELEAWFAHELGHVLQYSRHNIINIVGALELYLSSSDFRREIEIFADTQAIKRGYGKALISGIEKFLNSKNIPEMDKEFFRANYPGVEFLKKLQAEHEGKNQIIFKNRAYL